LTPLAIDLSVAAPDEVANALGIRSVTVLCFCAPCTGFSRTLNRNHAEDDVRNSLVGRSLLFVRAFRPDIFFMENARELIRGNFSHHWSSLQRDLQKCGYKVEGATHFLTRFGLPQQRERAIVTAVRKGLDPRTLEDLWAGYRVDPKAVFVRRAIGGLPALASGEAHPCDPVHTSPQMGEENTRRLALIPLDGGSWADLRNHPDRDTILTPAMLRYVAASDFGSHPDVYGRMAWDRPAPTIKRECGHIGNGRYSHPEQTRLCTVRELAILQGFPRDYVFRAKSLTNMYRHVGDAVPPLVSYQLAALCEWILTGRRPGLDEIILPKTHLRREDVFSVPTQRELFAG
jgi:DNA (cytosine-5)-methyltransferase 1